MYRRKLSPEHILATFQISPSGHPAILRMSRTIDLELILMQRPLDDSDRKKRADWRSGFEIA